VLCNDKPIPLFNVVETDPFANNEINLIIPRKQYTKAGIFQRRVAIHKFMLYCKDNKYSLTDNDINEDIDNLKNGYKFIYGRMALIKYSQDALNDTTTRLESPLYLYRAVNYLTSMGYTISRKNVMACNMFLSTPALWKSAIMRMNLKNINDVEPMYGALYLAASITGAGYTSHSKLNLMDHFKTNKCTDTPIDIYQKIRRSVDDIKFIVSKSNNGIFIVPTYINLNKFSQYISVKSSIAIMGLRIVHFSKIQ
jgi:hypothetical protein